MAHGCAQLATRKKARPTGEGGPALKSKALQLSRDWIKAERVRRFDKLQVGKFTRKIDKALPNEHTTQVYNSLGREEAGNLSQLRTGHTPLNSNLTRIWAEESVNCTCGTVVESIQHFLFNCPKWRSERSKLRETMADRWGDLAYALGGWSGRRDGRTSKFVDGARERWKPDMKVLRAVIQYVKDTKRFQPRTTVIEDTGATEEAGVAGETGGAEEAGETEREMR
jgi:hypothetical protein